MSIICRRKPFLIRRRVCKTPKGRKIGCSNKNKNLITKNNAVCRRLILIRIFCGVLSYPEVIRIDICVRSIFPYVGEKSSGVIFKNSPPNAVMKKDERSVGAPLPDGRPDNGFNWDAHDDLHSLPRHRRYQFIKRTCLTCCDPLSIFFPILKGTLA